MYDSIHVLRLHLLLSHEAAAIATASKHCKVSYTTKVHGIVHSTILAATPDQNHIVAACYYTQIRMMMEDHIVLQKCTVSVVKLLLVLDGRNLRQ